MFYYDDICGKKILRSDKLDNAFFTTRETVIKTKAPDNFELVRENKRLIKEYLKVEKLIHPSQTHTSNIDVASMEKDMYPNTDALILTDKRIGIFLNYADCTPIILYDKIKNVGAVIHGGWRGTAEKISAKTVLRLIRDFGCKPDNITALIGPCISKCCFEVNGDVYNKLNESIDKSEKIPEDKKVFADLKEINKIQLEQKGVKDIDICPYCTVCNNDMFFSYRKEDGTTNRHSGVLTLN